MGTIVASWSWWSFVAPVARGWVRFPDSIRAYAVVSLVRQVLLAPLRLSCQSAGQLAAGGVQSQPLPGRRVLSRLIVVQWCSIDQQASPLVAGLFSGPSLGSSSSSSSVR